MEAPETLDLADALADRALRRAALTAGLGGALLGMLAVVFLVVAQGALDATSIPQLGILACGLIVGHTAQALCQRSALALPRDPGSGPERAARAARALRTALIVLGSAAGVVAVLALVFLRPFPVAALSVAVSLALLSQYVLVLVLQRRGLLRATMPAG